MVRVKLALATLLDVPEVFEFELAVLLEVALVAEADALALDAGVLLPEVPHPASKNTGKISAENSTVFFIILPPIS
jgi:hypothetical protein